MSRLSQLELRDAALVFGRIDREAPPGDTGPDAVESFHIGRIAVADEEREPIVIDWRAPVAEPFYRATGRQPMGLLRRRHFSTARSPAAGHRGRALRRGAPRHRQRGRGALRAAWLQHPAGGARAGPHRPARRHRRHHPERAGRDHPLAAVGRAGGAGRSGHGQDGRGPASRRLPPLHVPLPPRGPGRPGHRPEPGVPPLHRARAPLAGRGRRGAGGAVRSRPRRRASAGSTDRSPPRSRATPAWPRSWPRRSATGSVR